jgi:hypothetical protein
MIAAYLSTLNTVSADMAAAFLRAINTKTTTITG